MVQAKLFETMFKEGCLPYALSDYYKLAILKKLVESMENAIEDPEEDVCFTSLYVSPAIRPRKDLAL